MARPLPRRKVASRGLPYVPRTSTSPRDAARHFLIWVTERSHDLVGRVSVNAQQRATDVPGARFLPKRLRNGNQRPDTPRQGRRNKVEPCISAIALYQTRIQHDDAGARQSRREHPAQMRRRDKRSYARTEPSRDSLCGRDTSPHREVDAAHFERMMRLGGKRGCGHRGQLSRHSRRRRSRQIPR